MESTQLSPLVFDAIKDPLLLVDPSGEVLLANAAALSFLELGPSRNVHDMVAADGRVAFDADDITGLMNQHESVRDYRMADTKGNECGVTLDIDQVRGTKDAEYRLLHFRNRSVEAHREFWKDEMIAMVSHEIKNPLSAMKNSVDILLSQMPGSLTEGQRRFLDTSGRSIDRLTHLLDGVLDVSRIQRGAFEAEPRRVEIRKFLDEVICSFQTLFNVSRVKMHWHVDSDISGAYLDPDKFEQVMINVLSNALKFTPEGGEINVLVRTAGVESMSDDLRLLPWSDLGKPRLLEIVVQDTGLGMSGEALERVFNAYDETAANGSGSAAEKPQKGAHLGLNISRALVEAQDGWIDIESELGIGTTVTAFIPQDRTTACTLSRIKRVGSMLGRYLGARRRVGLYVLGKFSTDNWEDISRSWKRAPVHNPTPEHGRNVPFCLWTLSNEIAIATLADHRDVDTVDEIFSSQFVMCDDDAYVLSSYGIGACFAPAETKSFAQLLGIATARMIRAREAMSKSAIEMMETGIEYITNEWRLEP